jgi:hypothetical protein
MAFRKALDLAVADGRIHPATASTVKEDIETYLAALGVIG